jgi:hypothetical protein
MRKTPMHLVTISTILMMVAAGMSVAVAHPIDSSCLSPDMTASDVQTQTITLYRFGPQGDVKEIQVTVPVEPGTDLSDLVAKKCSELLEKDTDIQVAIQKLGGNRSFFSLITSRGKGFFFDIKLRIPIPIPSDIKYDPDQPPYFFFLKIPIVYCKYSHDPQAQTIIKPMRQNATILTGNHSIVSLGFIGYRGWIGMISFKGLLFKSGFAGYSLLTRIRY